MRKISKFKNGVKIATGLMIGYPKAVSEGVTELLGDKLIDKSLEYLRKNSEFRDFENDVKDAIKETKDFCGITELETEAKEFPSVIKAGVRPCTGELERQFNDAKSTIKRFFS